MTDRCAGDTGTVTTQMHAASDISERAPLRPDHIRCSREVADRRRAVEVMREELDSESPHPLARTDIVLLLHNLTSTLLAHQDCDEQYLADALNSADKAVDLQARNLTAAIDGVATSHEIADERMVLDGLVDLRRSARTISGLEP